MADEQIPDLLADFREAMKWGHFAQASPQDRDPEQIFNTLMDDLEGRGASKKRIQQLRALGAKAVLSKKKLPPNLLKEVKGAGETFYRARESLRGVSPEDIQAAVQKSIAMLGKTGEFDENILNEIATASRKLGPEKFSQIPMQQVVRGLAERGEEGRLAKLWGNLRKKPARGAVGEVAKTVAAEGPVVAQATKAALKGGGLRTAGKLGLGRTLGYGVGAALTGMQFFDMFEGKPQEAEQLATMGRTSQGTPVASWETLRAMQDEQDLIRKRKMVLAQQEPGIFHELVRGLAEARATPKGPLRDSAIQLGNVGEAAPRYKPKDAPMDMLDQLLSQLGG